MKIEDVTRYAQEAQREERGQVVHIPASLQRRNGSYNRVLRTVQVQGACRVMSPYWKSTYEQRAYSTPAEFGIMTYQGKRYAVVRRQDDTSWEAVEAEPVPSHSSNGKSSPSCGQKGTIPCLGRSSINEETMSSGF